MRLKAWHVPVRLAAGADQDPDAPVAGASEAAGPGLSVSPVTCTRSSACCSGRDAGTVVVIATCFFSPGWISPSNVGLTNSFTRAGVPESSTATPRATPGPALATSTRTTSFSSGSST